jgi:hypothetical protein
VSTTVVVTASWPVLVLVCPPKFEARWVDDVSRSFDDVFARKEPFALITDTSAVASIPSARERKLLGDWASRPDQLRMQKAYNVGSSTIVRNTIMRGTLQALYWIWTPASPQHASKDLDEAWAWCISMLAERDVPLGASPRELRRIADREIVRVVSEIRATSPT